MATVVRLSVWFRFVLPLIHMCRLTSLFAIGFLFVATVPGQGTITFSGKLEERLVVDNVHIYQRVWSSDAATAKLKFSRVAEKGSVISTGELIDQRAASGKSLVLLVEPPSGVPYIWFDSNENGVFEGSEKVLMDIQPNRPDVVTTTLRLPIKNPYFRTFPIFIHYIRGFKHPRLAATDRLIAQSVYTVAWGRVDIKGQKVLFQYPFDPQQPAISTLDGVFGVDVNGDGKINSVQFSPEASYAATDEIVFPLGDIFVSTSRIDMATGQIIVRQREKREYQRIDLDVGTQMPDFAFVDLDGRQRNLSEFRGKYLMVDFWGVWCADCIRETPYHLAAYERFKKRGFEILGLNTDENVETLRSYVKKYNLVWPQATNESIKKLATISYRIHEYPATLLLAPDGKVMVVDQELLRSDALLTTLDRLLPK